MAIGWDLFSVSKFTAITNLSKGQWNFIIHSLFPCCSVFQFSSNTYCTLRAMNLPKISYLKTFSVLFTGENGNYLPVSGRDCKRNCISETVMWISFWFLNTADAHLCEMENITFVNGIPLMQRPIKLVGIWILCMNTLFTCYLFIFFQKQAHLNKVIQEP